MEKKYKKKYKKPITEIVEIEDIKPLLQVSGNCDCWEYDGKDWLGIEHYHHNNSKCTCRRWCRCRPY